MQECLELVTFDRRPEPDNILIGNFRGNGKCNPKINFNQSQTNAIMAKGMGNKCLNIQSRDAKSFKTASLLGCISFIIVNIMGNLRR